MRKLRSSCWSSCWSVVRFGALLLFASLPILATLPTGAAAEPVSSWFEVPEGVPTNVPKVREGLPQVLAVDGADVNVSDLLGNEAEVSISINPNAPDSLVVAGHSPDFSTLNTFYSTDGGASWTLVPLGDAQDGLTGATRNDPAVTHDAFGNVYVAYGVLVLGEPTEIAELALVVAKSTDGGGSYTQFTVVDQRPFVVPPGLLFPVPGNDKWLLATGLRPAPPAVPELYVAWTQNDVEGDRFDQRIVVSVSTDGGVSFSTPQVINDASLVGSQEGNFGAVPAVGPNGELYVAWHSYRTDQVLVDVSFDGGLSFGTDRVAATSATGFKTEIPADPVRGVFTGPVLDVDRSAGPYDGRLHLTYTDVGVGGLPDVDVWTRFSDDHGESWSTPLRVHDDAGTNSQFLPWLDVDPVTGLVTVVWYDARNDPANEQVELFAAVSDDGGESFLPNLLVSDGASDQSFGNPDKSDNGYLEYIGVAAFDCSVHPVWADNSLDPADLDFFTDRVQLTSSDTTLCAPRLLEVDPLFLDFPEVEVGTTRTQPVKLVNAGEGPIHVRDVEIAFPPVGFSIASAPAVPFTLEAGETAEIFVAFTPLAVGFEVGTLLVDNNTTGVAVSLYGEAVEGVPPTPSIEDVRTFFDASVADGTLVGFGFGSSGPGRLRALRNLLAAAARRIAVGGARAGCAQLEQAYLRTDGGFRPLDFVTGPAAPELADRIRALSKELGCDPLL